VYATVLNLVDVAVQVSWVSTNGDEVPHGKPLEPNMRHRLKTFEGHAFRMRSPTGILLKEVKVSSPESRKSNAEEVFHVTPCGPFSNPPKDDGEHLKTLVDNHLGAGHKGDKQQHHQGPRADDEPNNNARLQRQDRDDDTMTQQGEQAPPYHLNPALAAQDLRVRLAWGLIWACFLAYFIPKALAFFRASRQNRRASQEAGSVLERLRSRSGEKRSGGNDNGNGGGSGRGSDGGGGVDGRVSSRTTTTTATTTTRNHRKSALLTEGTAALAAASAERRAALTKRRMTTTTTTADSEGGTSVGDDSTTQVAMRRRGEESSPSSLSSSGREQAFARADAAMNKWRLEEAERIAEATAAKEHQQEEAAEASRQRARAMRDPTVCCCIDVSSGCAI
jgi:hypothetical protein